MNALALATLLEFSFHVVNRAEKRLALRSRTLMPVIIARLFRTEVRQRELQCARKTKQAYRGSQDPNEKDFPRGTECFMLANIDFITTVNFLLNPQLHRNSIQSGIWKK